MAKLFETFEARQKTNTGRRVLGWLSASIVLHLILVASIVYVPSVRSALQLASMFSGMEYGDEDYALQDMGGAQVTMLRAGDLFQYPAGYFAKNVPPATVTPALPPKPKPTPSPIPKPTLAPTPSPQTESSPAASPTPTASPASAEAATTAAEETTADNVQDKLKQLPKVNSKPFTDFFVRTKKLIDDGELDLSVPIRVSVEADRAADGRLTGFRKWSVSPDSPQHQKLAREFIAIISASKAFLYLDGAKNVRISGTLNASTVSASVVSPTESAEDAAKKVGGYNLLLAGVRFARAGKNEEVFLKNTRIRAVGRNIQVELTMPRSLAGEVIAKQLPQG